MKRILNYLYYKIINKLIDSLDYIERQRSKKGRAHMKIENHTINQLYNLAARESAQYLYRNLQNASLFNQPKELIKYSLENTNKEGLFLEFGVFTGASINYISKLITNLKIYGFDSFEGLEEQWTGHTVNPKKFDLMGNLPKVENNVELIAGWFSDTLPGFLKKHTESISFIHIDSDTYTPAKLILDSVRKRIQQGSIILFDEYHGYPGWLHHEFKAFQEFVKENDIRYKYIGFSRFQAAIRIDRIGNL